MLGKAVEYSIYQVTINLRRAGNENSNDVEQSFEAKARISCLARKMISNNVSVGG